MAKAIMVQGTTSDAGKSLLVTGLCRIFREDGFKVAPFKSQNMALNSYITSDGLEMGRAQVAQAEAAGLEPSALMNPILLKPTNDTGSQVIVNGRVWKDLSAKEYYAKKRELIPHIERAYSSLAAENDIIVIEGAGSPAEINLKENDIVNMYMAHMAKAPVLLAGDIDRGGVFASLLGTIGLFDKKDSDMVKGLIINKFRGDISILEPGLRIIEDKTEKPVVGVVPYLDVDIDDEDSLSSRITSKAKVDVIDICVVKLPRLSNFTDFNVFGRIDGVSLRYVERVDEFGNPDMVLIPGSKNTMEDLLWMRQAGLEALVIKYGRNGGPVFGICGGYQMLGEEISDPHGVERGGTVRGMGLLPIQTCFSKEKVTTQISTKFGSVFGAFRSLSDMDIEGYEIHMGRTTAASESDGTMKDLTMKSSEDCSPDSKSGSQLENIYGSYIHGIFDGDGIAEKIVETLLDMKGISGNVKRGMSLKEYKEVQYHRLAEGLRNSMDMNRVYEILEEGIR